MKNKSTSAFMPLLFTVLGFGGIGYLGIYRIAQLGSGVEQLLGCAACALYLSWVLWEMRISVGELKKEEATDDRYTMEICAIVKLSLLTAMFAAEGTFSIDRGIFGIFIMLAGIFIRGAAIKKLGKAYSHRIRRIGDHIVTEGPYQFIRHPAYLGTLMAHTGFTLVFLNIFSLVALLFWWGAVFMRASVEDRCLSGAAKYQSFAKKVRWKMIPAIW